MSQDERIPAKEARTHDRKFLFLFLFLLFEIVLYPYAGNQGIRYECFRSLSIFITVASVYAVSFRRSTWIIAIIFAIPVALHRGLMGEMAETKLALVGLLLSFAFDVFIVAAMFRRVFRTQMVTSASVFGAVSIYLMMGFAFARLYVFLAALQRGAFYLDPVLNHHAFPDYTDLIYYSFGTITSLGAAGIAPLTAQARSVSVIEAILGVLYLAVLVSRLIAMYVPRVAQRILREPSSGESV